MIIDKLPPNYINNIDDLFEHLYGVRPKKDGVYAELLYYIIKKNSNIDPNKEYEWNKEITFYEDNNVQIDVLEKIKDHYSQIIDIKDWKKNVDRPEVQKLESTTLHFEKNYNRISSCLISTKGFSNGAKEWAKKSLSKSKINLYIMRLSEYKDIENKLLEIVINMDIVLNMKMFPIFSNDDKEYNYKTFNKKTINMTIEKKDILLVNKNKRFDELEKNILSDCKWENLNDNIQKATLYEPIYIYFDNKIIKASGIEFTRYLHKQKIVVTKGKCLISLCDENGNVLEVFFEEELLKYKDEVLNMINNI